MIVHFLQLWLTFAPVADQTAEHLHVTLDQVNWLSVVYMVVAIPLSFITTWMLDTLGLRPTVSTNTTQPPFFFFGLGSPAVPPPSPPQRAFDIMAGTSSQDTVIIKGHSVRTRKKQNVESPRLLFSYSAQSILFSIYYELFSNYRETFRKVVWLIV